MEQKPTVTVVQRSPIRSLAVDKAQLRHLLEILQERCVAAGEKEAAEYSPVGLPPEKVEADRRSIAEGFNLFVTVTGTDGAQLHGAITTIFDSPNFPDDVRSVLFDSAMPLRNKNYSVGNSCTLYLNFSRPGIFNFSLLPSLETPNESNIEVQGRDATWVNGVFHEAIRFVGERPSTFRWLHRHTIYDVLLWFAGFPLGFWACNKASPMLARILSASLLQTAATLYVFLATLVGFRILFHYARWIWPTLEYRSQRSGSARHKTLWGAVVLGLLVNLLWDLINAR